jgi:hypothetical protein
MLKQINQIFTIKFISVLIISFPSAIIADYFDIPLGLVLRPNDCSHQLLHYQV